MLFGRIRPVLAGIALAAMAGCSVTPQEFGAGVRNTGAAVAQSASDASIHLALQRDMGREFPRYFAEMATEVHEGRVLIVGTTRTPQDRVRASQVAWQIKGVNDVVNELQVAEEQTGLAYLRDARISNQLRLRMATSLGVSSSNFDFETVNSVIYILGVARDRGELEHVAELAATIAGVERVVSHALLANDPRRGREQRPASIRF